MIDEDIEIADEAEGRQDPLHEAAWDLIEKVEDFIGCFDLDFMSEYHEPLIRDAIAKLEKILKGAS